MDYIKAISGFPSLLESGRNGISPQDVNINIQVYVYLAVGHRHVVGLDPLGAPPGPE